MKAEDIILQLHAKVPTITNLFSDELSVTSLTFSGSTATATTSVDHGLTTGDLVTLAGAVNPNPISSLTQVDDVATAVTTFDHALTMNQGITPVGGQISTFVTVSGATEGDYNGTLKLISVPNRTTFVYQIANDPSSPATGSPILEETFVDGYNGLFNVTVTGTDTFTYTLSAPVNTDAIGTILAQKNVRISGAVNEEKIIQIYTSQNMTDLWAFVVMEDVIASKARSVTSDAISTFGTGTDPRQRLLQNFSIYVCATTTSNIAARQTRDLMEDIHAIFAKSIFGFKGPTELTEGQSNGIVFDQHAVSFYDSAKYIHRFQYQSQFDLVFADSIGPGINRPFRDIKINFIDPQGSDIIIRSIDVDLDEDAV